MDRYGYQWAANSVEVRPGLGPGRSSTIAACPPVLAAISESQNLKESTLKAVGVLNLNVHNLPQRLGIAPLP